MSMRPISLAGPFLRSRRIKSLKCLAHETVHSQWLATSSINTNLAGRVVVSTSQDPFFNLAVEEVLMQQGQVPVAMLYTNLPCVVIGRNQNPWKEARVQEIVMVRRRSGGGTVFHDVGNLNWGIISARSAFSKTGNADLVRKALNDRFGLSILQNERGDLVLNERKVSGSAYRLTSKGALHHGTLLVCSNLASLRGILHPRVDLEGKWVNSVPAPGGVMNLADAAPEATLEQATNALSAVLSESEAILLGPESLPRGMVEDVAKVSAELANYEHVFGATRPFTQRFPSWGHVEVAKGCIVDLRNEHGQQIEGAELLIGARYQLPDLERAMIGISDRCCHLSQLIHHFREAFGQELRIESQCQ